MRNQQSINIGDRKVVKIGNSFFESFARVLKGTGGLIGFWNWKQIAK